MALEPLTPQRRRQQTRDYLIQAAAKVFAERGFHGASLDEVAAAAGFTKGAVYSNFKSKEDLFLALLQSHYEAEMEALRTTLASSEGGPDAHLTDFAALVRRNLDELGDEWVTLFEEFRLYAMRNPSVRARLAEFDRIAIDAVAGIINAEREKHGIVPKESAQHAARIVVAMMRGISTMRVIESDAVDESFLESVMSFIGRAMT
jgi:AcrR family transcriptional regulator